MARAIPYSAAIAWLALNDCCAWVDQEGGSTSVSSALVSDIYGKDDATIKSDLMTWIKKNKDTLANIGPTP